MSIPSKGRYAFQDVQADHTIHAKFERDEGEPVFYKILATADIGGSIEPGGLTGVMGGGSQVYTFSADPGYHIADLMVDGVSVPYAETRG